LQRRSLQTVTASHAIYGEQNGSGLASDSGGITCYPSVVAGIRLFASLLSFSQAQILRALLAWLPAFFLLLTGSEVIAAAQQIVCALYQAHSSAYSWVRFDRPNPDSYLN
jgi:hypothetical protein